MNIKYGHKKGCFFSFLLLFILLIVLTSLGLFNDVKGNMIPKYSFYSLCFLITLTGAFVILHHMVSVLHGEGLKKADFLMSYSIVLCYFVIAVVLSDSFWDLNVYVTDIENYVNQRVVYDMPKDQMTMLYPPLFIYLFTFVHHVDFQLLGYSIVLLKVFLVWWMIYTCTKNKFSSFLFTLFLLSSIPFIYDIRAGNLEVFIASILFYYTYVEYYRSRSFSHNAISVILTAFAVSLKPYLLLFPFAVTLFTKTYKKFIFIGGLILSVSLLQYLYNPHLMTKYLKVVLWKSEVEFIPTFFNTNSLLAVLLGGYLVWIYRKEKDFINFETLFLVCSLLLSMMSPRLSVYSYTLLLVALILFLYKTKIPTIYFIAILLSSSFGLGGLYLLPSIPFNIQLANIITVLAIYLLVVIDIQKGNRELKSYTI